MKFFHVYNEDCLVGLEKNGLINKDTGFKIQHLWSVPSNRLFNNYAAKGTALYNLIKSEKIPFYVDRIAGGDLWYSYEFDKELIHEYREMLGDWFLGFQLHESGSNRRKDEWPRLRKLGDGPYDVNILDKALLSDKAVTPDGKRLHMLSQDSIYYYANKKYSETYQEFLEEFNELFARRMADTDNNIIPCDSYYLATKMQNDIGMRTFMPEVGCQIPFMRVAIALSRGMAKASGKTWGTYYECWRSMPDRSSTMPRFNNERINEWYMKQEMTKYDFSSNGKNGGSSRLLQNRIYYYSLMSGAHYLAEEWGLSCNYSDMNTYELSEYGLVKKAFIDKALGLQGIEANIPFAIVLPKRYSCVDISGQIYDMPVKYNRGCYLDSTLNEADTEYFGHLEGVIKLFL